MSAGADRWITWTTTGCVALLALIASTVSYLHMHTLVTLHGQPGGGGADPTVGGRNDRRCLDHPAGGLPARPHGWSPAVGATGLTAPPPRRIANTDDRGPAAALTLLETGPQLTRPGRRVSGQDLQQQAWHWAITHRGADGSLPSGKQIASHFGRHERWGRLVKRTGLAGHLSVGDAPDHRSSDGREMPAAALHDRRAERPRVESLTSPS
jgi:hypothetical protein